jgi:hypothetical protein
MHFSMNQSIHFVEFPGISQFTTRDRRERRAMPQRSALFVICSLFHRCQVHCGSVYNTLSVSPIVYKPRLILDCCKSRIQCRYCYSTLEKRRFSLSLSISLSDSFFFPGSLQCVYADFLRFVVFSYIKIII